MTKQKICDVAVIGGGPAGICAALAAARQGMKVLLAERNGYLGGNATIGLPLLGFLDAMGRQVVGGIAQELIDALVDVGGSYGHNPCPMHHSVTVVHPDLMKMVALEKCREAGVEVLLHSELTRVHVENGRVTGFEVMGKGNTIEVQGKVVVDATGDGDAAYLAGASFEKGGEGSGRMQPPTLMFSVSGFDEERFFAYLEEHPEDLQPADSMHVEKGYDVAYFRSHPSYVFLGLYDLLKRLRAEGKNPIQRDTLIYINSTLRGQIYINTTRILHFDGTDIEELTRGEEEGMQQIQEILSLLKNHVPGFEGCSLASITPFIGVRETRRFKGIKRLTSEQILQGMVPRDSIALGAYKIDIHSADTASTDLIEITKPYGIPLGCLISAELEGLILSGRHISVDSRVLASMRVMPTCMAIGQAGGILAAMAVQDELALRDVPAEQVTSALCRDGAILA